jgi:hypothetical protein
VQLTVSRGAVITAVHGQPPQIDKRRVLVAILIMRSRGGVHALHCLQGLRYLDAVQSLWRCVGSGFSACKVEVLTRLYFLSYVERHRNQPICHLLRFLIHLARSSWRFGMEILNCMLQLVQQTNLLLGEVSTSVRKVCSQSSHSHSKETE